MLKKKKFKKTIIIINKFIKNINNKRKNVEITIKLINDNINIIIINKKETKTLRKLKK